MWKWLEEQSGSCQLAEADAATLEEIVANASDSAVTCGLWSRSECPMAVKVTIGPDKLALISVSNSSDERYDYLELVPLSQCRVHYKIVCGNFVDALKLLSISLIAGSLGALFLGVAVLNEKIHWYRELGILVAYATYPLCAFIVFKLYASRLVKLLIRDLLLNGQKRRSSQTTSARS